MHIFFKNANSGGQPIVPQAMLRYLEINTFLPMLLKLSEKKPA